MSFFSLLRRFIPPYRGQLSLNILFNLLSTILSLFSFAAIIPVLQILFGISEAVTDYIPLSSASGLTDLLPLLKNNLYFWLSSEIAAGGAGSVLFLLGIFLVLTTGLKCGSAWLASYFLIPIRTGVLRDVRQQLYDKVVSLPIGYFTEEKRGDVMSRMTSDVNEIEVSIMASLDMLFKDPIMILIYLVTLFCISWQLTLFVLLLLPTAGWLIGRIGRSLKRRSTRGQEQNAEILTQIDETLSGLRVVKAFNAEDKLRSRFLLLNNDTRRTFNRIHRKYALAHPMSEFLGTALIAVLLWYGGGLILSENSSIDAATFIYYLVIFYSIINPAKDLSKATYSVRKGLASLERVDKILQTESTIREPEHPATLDLASLDPASDAPFISFSDVNFSYVPGIPVLEHVSVDIRRGQTVAFVGQSGSGKTTLLDLLPRFYDPQAGAVMVAGTDIRNLRTHDLRALMGNVNQDAILFNDTILHNITFGVDPASFSSEQEMMQAVREAARKANALDFIEATPDGFQTVIGDRGSRLSGGQRQRLSIARAILKNPAILILDEATSALDTESEHLVQEALDSLLNSESDAGSAPCTRLVVAHRLSTIRNADLICVLHEGRIVEQGKHADLLALGGYYARLIEMQQA